MFESDWRLEVDTLTTDPNAKGPASNVMGRESSKQALSELYHVDEVEFSSRYQCLSILLVWLPR